MHTITLKNIPDSVYEPLKRTAKVHRRSLNSEIIACLERALTPTVVNPEERLERARRLRQGVALERDRFDPEEIEMAIRQGRP